MDANNWTPPFDRTVCACRDCTDCCRQRPGHLISGDLERIADYLKLTVDAAKTKFRRSKGAIVLATHTIPGIGTVATQHRILTIAPKRKPDGSCTFLNQDGHCTIHPVSPFGCRYFDTHMSVCLSDARSSWGLVQIVRSHEYGKLRDSLED
jgi:Fe-S-cluster containining protein